MAETAIRFRDDPWSRLPWLVPAALVLTLLSQIAFLSLLRQPANQSAVPRPVDVQIVELPVTPPAAPPTPPVRKPPPPPRPRVEPPTPRPAPPQSEARIEPPRDPTPPAAEEPVTQAPAEAATVPVPPATGATGTAVGPPTQAPVAALPPSRAPQPPAPPRITHPARPRGGYQVRPEYPAAARRAGAEGTTLLRVHVRTDGTIDNVQVSRSAGYAALDEAAAAAVTRWRFEPARSGSDAVAVWVLIPVEFRLQNEN